ncbi:alpha-2-macroglobulin family protein [Flavobacterium ardleyense]|uniref:Alpha-2-macroglobulin family protein n=1 Tax=Flavobacterium ardleyense TaxID=2038737 RepID=A0ABW5Z3A3_9FLAO
MRNIFLFILCISSFTLFGQYDANWKKVYAFEQGGEIKPAEQEVQKIYKKAKHKKDEVTILKCFFYLSKFEQVFDKNAQTTIIKNLQHEFKDAKPVSKALLNYVYAKILTDYQKGNRYSIRSRTTIQNNKDSNFLTWTSEDFTNEIDKSYAEILKNASELRAITIDQYKDVFEYTSNVDIKNFSIYDYLLEKKLAYDAGTIFFATKTNTLELGKLLSLEPKLFIIASTSTINDDKIRDFIVTLQENERYLIKNKLFDKLDTAYHNRILITNKKTQPQNQGRLKLDELEKSTNNIYLKQELRVERAAFYASLPADSLNKNYKQQALNLLDTVFQVKTNLYALHLAENLQEKILSKSLQIQIKKTIYPFENTRAFVAYKNIDSVKISCFKFPVALNDAVNGYKNQIYADSLVVAFVNKNKAYKSYTRTLPKRIDYNNHSTEIILEPVEAGNYLVLFETNDTFDSDGNLNNSFSYEQVNATQFIVIKDETETDDIIYLYNRNSGQPIDGVKIVNQVTIHTSDEIGKTKLVKTLKNQNENYNNLITITKDKDTLIQNYNRNYIYNTSDKFNKSEFEDAEAKAMVFFDRAIYRPGQKIFYKGIIVQKKDSKKSVVPFLTVRVTINDVNDSVLKEYDVQTNEFGSFNGEFEIPKNILTGRFYIGIEEPNKYEKDEKYYDEVEEEHSFWDNVDFEDNIEFSFQVEEYKRPTFEVTFKEIKENYTINDSLKIIGNAKALAGNNLTDAKVTYTVSRNYFTEDEGWGSDTNYIDEFIYTDTDGNFTIPFTATIDSVSSDKINNIRYSITATVTDSNGETRNATETVNVNKNTLKLTIISDSTLIEATSNVIKINSSTYNNYPIDAKGEIKIYEKKSKQFLKERAFNFPEIQAIDRAEFQVLFPHEPYEKKDIESENILVKTLQFDTKVSKEITLDFLKNAKPASYEIEATAFDSKNNLVEDKKIFKLISKKNAVSENQLFTYTDISKKESAYYEIEVNSIISNLFVTLRYYADQSNLQQEITAQLQDGKNIFRIKKEKNYKSDVNFHFSSFWKNQSHSQTYCIKKEETEINLSVEINSLRTKIEPGSVEKWSFKILNSKLEAEVLASMYDSSLDQFTTQDWTNAYFNSNNNSHNSPNVYLRNNTSYVNFKTFNQAEKYFSNYMHRPELYWFGFNFNDAQNSYTLNEYLKKIKNWTAVPKNAKSVTGIVYDNFGPIAGATVQVKGTKKRTFTDFDGEFTIEASKGEVLEIAYIGTQTAEIEINTNRILEIKLKNNDSELQEVVVMSYETRMKKAYMTASFTVISDTITEQSANEDLLQILQGRSSGMSIATGSGQPGSKPTVILRGNASINENLEPLIVMDGIIITEEEFRNLKSDELDSILILKGKEATAIYGSRGANGVIIMTTKKAVQDLTHVKTRTNFNETAFFYPNLKTDKEGNISFEFTTPESLTKWNLRLFAHNKNAETGQLKASIISQKDIMLQTNMPRFVREKDKIKISAKVVNMTSELKSGIAMLQLFDVATNTLIDEICANKNNIRNFACKPKQSVPVEWVISIPEGLQGLHYRIVAKSGNYADGEENILPVLSNKILLTESIPIFVKANSKKEYSFDSLKNNESKTLKNHLFTLEYTSNPVWFALQSLPYLMEYEHECSEQTFARYYANSLASELINSNPKVAALFTSWKSDDKATSKLTQNEELKSIVLNETPWLLDSENDAVKNKRLALLMDLNTMKESQASTLKKLAENQNTSGGFSWFKGGQENIFITQHILAGLGHIEKMFPNKNNDFKEITSKAITYLDADFVQKNSSKSEKTSYSDYSNLHYMYARSFYLDKMPISKKTDSIIRIETSEHKTKWLTYSLYKKALLAVVMNRYNDKEFSQKIINNLKETAARNDEDGMYWINNKNGYYWYQSPIETQALLIEAFSEIETDKKYVEEMKAWLLKKKQINSWSSTKATSEAIYAIMLYGTDYTSIKDNTTFTIGNEKVLHKKLSEKDKEAATGYVKLNWSANEISKEMGLISVENKSKVAGYGGAYWQYFEDLENIKTDSTQTLYITKTLFKKIKTAKGDALTELNKESLKTGDLITIRLVLKTENDLEFVHLKDLRASCFEPVDVISTYERKDNLSYYKNTKDVATHFFFDRIAAGTFVLEYDVRVNNSGNFNDGIATIQSMYAPEHSAHSTSTKINIEN